MPDNPASTDLTVDEIRKIIGRLTIKEVLAVIDALKNRFPQLDDTDEPPK